MIHKIYLPKNIAVIALTAASSFGIDSTSRAVGTPITFSSQTNNGAAFVSDTEMGFSVTPTLGSWFQSTVFGDGAPSIYAGPIGSPGSSAIEVTDGGKAFTLGSTEFASNLGSSTYFFFGFSGSTLAFEEVGTLGSSGAVFTTVTTSAKDATTPVTTLTISVIPGSGTSSVNVDDINVNTVPEPVTSSLLGVGAVALLWLRRRRA